MRKRHRGRSQSWGKETDKSQHVVTRETDPLPRHTREGLEAVARGRGPYALADLVSSLISAPRSQPVAGAQVPGLPTGFPEAVPQLCPQREYPPPLSPLSHQASA